MRCSETGKTLDEVINELKKELKKSGIKLAYKKTKLSPGEISEPNQILINNRPIEEWLPEASVLETACPSCCQIIGEEVLCRAVEFQGKTYEALPEKLIRQAVNYALNLE